MDAWLPRARDLRGRGNSWGRVAKSLGLTGSPDRHWTADRLSRAVHRLVAEGLADRELIAAVARPSAKDDVLNVVSGMKGADPTLSLRAIASRLEEMRIRPPRGGAGWSASSVKALLDRGRRLGLIASGR
jgi:hypothetical protein